MGSEYDARNKEGCCARGACLAKMSKYGRWYNTGSYAYYCTECAYLINKFNAPSYPKGLCSRREYGTSRREQRLKERENKGDTNENT